MESYRTSTLKRRFSEIEDEDISFSPLAYSDEEEEYEPEGVADVADSYTPTPIVKKVKIDYEDVMVKAEEMIAAERAKAEEMVKTERLRAEQKIELSDRRYNAANKMLMRLLGKSSEKKHFLLRVIRGQDKGIFKIKIYDLENLGRAVSTVNASLAEKEMFVICAFSEMKSVDDVKNLIKKESINLVTDNDDDDRELIVDSMVWHYLNSKKSGHGYKIVQWSRNDCVDKVLKCLFKDTLVVNLTTEICYGLNSEAIELLAEKDFETMERFISVVFGCEISEIKIN